MRKQNVIIGEIIQSQCVVSEMDMGWVNPWVGLGWVLGPNFSFCNGLGYVGSS